MRNQVIRAAVAFILAGLVYLAVLIGCLGSSTGSGLGAACSVIGPVLRVPFFYILPYAESRYLGVDAMVLTIVGNAVVWGAIAAILAVNIGTRKRERPTLGTQE